MNSSVEVLKARLTSPARSYLWDVVFPMPFGGGDTTMLMVRAQGSSVPAVAVKQIKIPYRQTGGAVYHGKLDYGNQTWSLDFVEGEDAAVWKEFVRGIRQVVNTTTGLGKPDNLLKKPVVLTLDATTDLPYLRIMLVGCWVQSVGQIDLKMNSEGEIHVPVTLSYDYWLHG